MAPDLGLHEKGRNAFLPGRNSQMCLFYGTAAEQHVNPPSTFVRGYN